MKSDRFPVIADAFNWKETETKLKKIENFFQTIYDKKKVSKASREWWNDLRPYARL